MWELSISVDSVNFDIAKYIYQHLKSHTTEFGCVVTCYEQFEKIFILLACPKEEQGRVVMCVERCIVKVICSFYKERFLNEHLHLPIHENMSYMAFKKALLAFDKETDFYIISKHLELEKDFYIDSFYNFKLKALRDKWQELITLANENSDYLVSNEAFFDLLKFLIDNLEIGQDEVNVFEDENGYSIKTPNEFDCFDGEKLSKEDLISSIIEICPKRINLFCKSDDVAAGFLTKLFDERVNICYNKSLENIENFSVLK